jgi:MFS transporter, DHA1 family, inner membrane transport protein
MILHVLTLCAFAVATTEFILVGLLPEIAADLSVSLPVAGFLVTAYMLVVTVGGPAGAIVTSRLPRRGLLMGTMALALVSAGLSAVAGTYGLLLIARLGSALAQALFVAVASQVAMLVVPPARQTTAVARVFNGFALATVLGLPIGTLVGQRYGWHAPFALVSVLAAAGLIGILAFSPAIPHSSTDRTDRALLLVMLRPSVLLGLLTTTLTFTGFVAAFTYVAPMLRDVTGLGDVEVSVALVVYGMGTVVGNILAGHVRPRTIVSVMPLPLLVLAGSLLTQGFGLQHPATAMLDLFVMGASAFVMAPLLQTWLMGEVGPSAAGVAAAVNIAVAGLAAALGASLGGAVISAGLGLEWIGPVASMAPLGGVASALAIRHWSSRSPTRSAARQPEPVSASWSL